MGYMNKLCIDITERCVGSEGNRQASLFFKERLKSLGWQTISQEFSAMDWKNDGAVLQINKQDFRVQVSPYSLGFQGAAQLESASTIAELENGDFKGKILLLHGELVKEQLMPKNFVFYNPEEHQKIVTALEQSGALALICATERNASLAGGVYPFPLIEDGDFDIPSVYMTEEDGEKILKLIGKTATLKISAERIPSKGYNVVGKIGGEEGKRIVVTAHIDAKKGTPGATDNATGITVLLILAELLQDYKGSRQIELVAFNGEDDYAVPGQMKYITENKGKFENILLNVNIDGAAYKKGKTTFSFFDLPKDIKKASSSSMKGYPDVKEGVQWPQGDHSIFLQYGVPAIAVSSEWFIESDEGQDITHTEKDNMEIVDIDKVIEIAEILNKLIKAIEKMQ
ncbi:M28 family peptidase [Isachenkonia alkalipeptolytica]|nr:M28 family peptidase [Isachenkonia alkalipeptolytica]